MDNIILQNTPQDKPHYVYVYRYPKSMGGAIFYVGKGKTYNDRSDRIDDHENEARRGVQSAKCNAIREIWETGEHVIKEKIAFFETEEDAFLYEWGIINMTTYADSLTNIYRGRGYPHRLNLYDKILQVNPFCIQRHQGRGNSAHLIIYHKILDIKSFCANKGIKITMLLDVLEGKTNNFKGYSVVTNCECSHTNVTTEIIKTVKDKEDAKCGYCGCIIPTHKIIEKSKNHYCCDDHVKRHYKYMNFARERKKKQI